VCIDACKEGLNGFLTKNGHVICYESKKLKEHEINYATLDLELETMIHALRMLRNYLMKRKFELRIDHSGLKYLFEQPSLNTKQTIWLEFLSKYDFDKNHINGKENTVVDALSIRVHKMNVVISIYRTHLKYRILEAITSDQHYVQVKERLQKNNVRKKYKDYNLEGDGILLFWNIVYILNS
jgi:hypothetical protein